MVRVTLFFSISMFLLSKSKPDLPALNGDGRVFALAPACTGYHALARHGGHFVLEAGLTQHLPFARHCADGDDDLGIEFGGEQSGIGLLP